MYCPSCGVSVVQPLSFCNHCGAQLGAPKSEDLAKESNVPSDLVWAIVAVFVVGLGVIIGLMAVMKNQLNFNPGLILFFTLLSFLLMISVESVFVWLLLRSQKRPGTAELPSANQQATKELGEGSPLFLTQPRDSVTDATTRTFEPVPRERQTKSNKRI